MIGITVLIKLHPVGLGRLHPLDALAPCPSKPWCDYLRQGPRRVPGRLGSFFSAALLRVLPTPPYQWLWASNRNKGAKTNGRYRRVVQEVRGLEDQPLL